MVFIRIIPAAATERLKSKNNFSNYLLIVDTYSKILKNYGMEIITTEEVMDKVDMFQYIFGKVDDFFC